MWVQRVDTWLQFQGLCGSLRVSVDARRKLLLKETRQEWRGPAGEGLPLQLAWLGGSLTPGRYILPGFLLPEGAEVQSDGGLQTWEPTLGRGCSAQGSKQQSSRADPIRVEDGWHPAMGHEHQGQTHSPASPPAHTPPPPQGTGSAGEGRPQGQRECCELLSSEWDRAGSWGGDVPGRDPTETRAA